MNLSQISHALNWWREGGNINIDLLEKVLKAKELNPVHKKKRLSIQKTILYTGK